MQRHMMHACSISRKPQNNMPDTVNFRILRYIHFLITRLSGYINITTISKIHEKYNVFRTKKATSPHFSGTA